MSIKKTSTALVTILSIMSTIFPGDSEATTKNVIPSEDQAGRIVTQYYKNHPEELEELLKYVAKKKQEKEYYTIIDNVIKNKEKLLNSSDTPNYGDEESDVSVILFFDYQCIYCSKLHPHLNQVISSSKKVRFYFKEWPIFSQSWKESDTAAQVGLEIWKKHGGDSYLNYHNSLYKTGHNEGELTFMDIKNASQGLINVYDINPNNKILIQENFTLAANIGLNGTPVLIVLPSKNPTKDKTTVFLGMTDEIKITEAIERAR